MKYVPTHDGLKKNSSILEHDPNAFMGVKILKNKKKEKKRNKKNIIKYKQKICII